MSLFIACKQAHQLISEGMDRRLSLSERSKLKMHLAICDYCTSFNGQMSFMRTAMRQSALWTLASTEPDKQDGGE
ncbi:zf-HC2 domain-containing protein [Undibacterium sp. Ji50W]|uniref:zf-HC2 domain-containing protein n=1 Tax=Undibacterium sp. Ji50W TaxID=3413041 RepID=UPI003BF3DF82